MTLGSVKHTGGRLRLYTQHGILIRNFFVDWRKWPSIN